MDLFFFQTLYLLAHDSWPVSSDTGPLSHFSDDFFTTCTPSPRAACGSPPKKCPANSEVFKRGHLNTISGKSLKNTIDLHAVPQKNGNFMTPVQPKPASLEGPHWEQQIDHETTSANLDTAWSLDWAYFARRFQRRVFCWFFQGMRKDIVSFKSWKSLKRWRKSMRHSWRWKGTRMYFVEMIHSSSKFPWKRDTILRPQFFTIALFRKLVTLLQFCFCEKNARLALCASPESSFVQLFVHRVIMLPTQTMGKPFNYGIDVHQVWSFHGYFFHDPCCSLREKVWKKLLAAQRISVSRLSTKARIASRCHQASTYQNQPNKDSKPTNQNK